MEHSEKLRLQPLVKDRHTPLVPLSPKAKAAIWRFARSGRGECWTELSPQEEEQVDETSPALHWTNSSGTLRSPKHSIPITGGSSTRCFPAYLSTCLSQEHQILLPGKQRETFLPGRQSKSFPVLSALSQSNYRGACRIQL